MNHPQPEQHAGQWHLVAAVAAWVCPGLGHIMLGSVKRGVILAVTLGMLWFGGLLIGGIGVINWQAQPFWFAGQMLIGPSLAVDHLVRQHGFSDPHANPTLTPSFGRVHEQGTLYTALAGLLNLMAILDVLYRERKQETEDRKQEPEATGVDPNQRAMQTPSSPTVAPLALLPLLGWRPLLDPLPFDGYWYYIPLVIGIAVVYKTIKLEDLRHLPRDATVLAAQITVFMVLIAAALGLLVAVV